MSRDDRIVRANSFDHYRFTEKNIEWGAQSSRYSFAVARGYKDSREYIHSWPSVVLQEWPPNIANCHNDIYQWFASYNAAWVWDWQWNDYPHKRKMQIFIEDPSIAVLFKLRFY
jgi:hypothetical protein